MLRPVSYTHLDVYKRQLMGDVRTEHFNYLTKEQWSDTEDKVNFMEV